MGVNYEQIKEELNKIWISGVDKYFEEQQKEHVARLEREIGAKDPERIYVSPSEASIFMYINGVPILQGKCHRDIFFSSIKMRESNPIQPYTKRKLITGRLIEKVEHEIEKRSGKYVGSNELLLYNIDDTVSILGELDSIMEDSQGNIYIKEIKTVYGYMAKRNHITGTKKVKPYPRWSAVIQLMIYIAITGARYGVLKFIDGASMMDERSYVIEIDNIEADGRVVDQVVKIDGERRDDIRMSVILSRYIQLAHYLKNKELPPRECMLEYDTKTIERLAEAGEITKGRIEKYSSGKTKVGDWQCRLCRYRDICYGDEKALNKMVEEAIEKIETDKNQSSVCVSGDIEIVW